MSWSGLRTITYTRFIPAWDVGMYFVWMKPISIGVSRAFATGPWVRPVQAVQRADAAVPVRLPVKLLRQPDIPALPLVAGEAVQRLPAAQGPSQPHHPALLAQ